MTTHKHKSPMRLELSRIDRDGLRLTVNEDRALTAVQVLLNRNVRPDTPRVACVDSPSYPSPWPSVRSVPVLDTTWEDYYQAYALELGKTQHLAREALKRIAGLAPRRRPFYLRRENDSLEKAALVRLVYMPEPSTRKRLVIIPTPPLWDGIEKAGDASSRRGEFWVPKDDDLFPRAFRYLRDQGMLGGHGEWRQPAYMRFLYKIQTQARYLTKEPTRDWTLTVESADLRAQLDLSNPASIDQLIAFARGLEYLEEATPLGDGNWELRVNPAITRLA